MEFNTTSKIARLQVIKKLAREIGLSGTTCAHTEVFAADNGVLYSLKMINRKVDSATVKLKPIPRTK